MAGDKLFDKDYMKRLEYLRALARRLFAREHVLVERIKKAGSGVEFADHRPYAAGDDVRNIDWNVFGRLGKLIVRLFEQDEDLNVHFLIDESASMSTGGKFDHARKTAVALSYLALSNIDRVTVHTFAEGLRASLPPRRGRGQAMGVMQFLEGRKTGGKTDLVRSVREFVSKAPRRGLVVLLTDFLSAGDFEDALKFLRYNRFDVVGLHTIALEDEAPEITGELALKDSETGEVLAASSSRETLNAYRRAFNSFQEKIDRAFVKHRAMFLAAPVRIPFEDIVLAVLREGLFTGK